MCVSILVKPKRSEQDVREVDVTFQHVGVGSDMSVVCHDIFVPHVAIVVSVTRPKLVSKVS